MAQKLEGATGGNTVNVGTDGKLQTASETETQKAHAAATGNAYNFNTDWLTLTDANESAMIYMKNNDTELVRCHLVAVGFDVSTGGTAALGSIRIYRNITGGTIISDATETALEGNFHHGEFSELEVDCFMGGQGKTVVGGNNYVLVGSGDAARSAPPFDIFLAKGTSIAVTVTPPASNTSMRCYVALVVHSVHDIGLHG